MGNGRFATVINCMDGRVQLLVNNYIKKVYDVEFVDTITLAGPSKILGEKKQTKIMNNVKFRSEISVNKHFSKVIAIVGHVDCAGAAVSDEKQKQLVLESAKLINDWNLDVQVLSLWVDDTWTVRKLA